MWRAWVSFRQRSAGVSLRRSASRQAELLLRDVLPPALLEVHWLSEAGRP